MAIKVDSSQWTGESGGVKAMPVVWGEFADEASRDAAVAQLRGEGVRHSAATTDPNPPVDQPDEDPEGADLRNRRQLGVGVAMAASAMGAAGLVVASGGALLPAVIAAAAAGTGAGVAGEAVASAVSETPEESTQRLPPSDAPAIGLRAPDEATQHAAESTLRELGAIRVVVDAD